MSQFWYITQGHYYLFSVCHLLAPLTLLPPLPGLNLETINVIIPLHASTSVTLCIFLFIELRSLCFSCLWVCFLIRQYILKNVSLNLQGLIAYHIAEHIVMAEYIFIE